MKAKSLSGRSRLPNALFGYSCDPAYIRQINKEGKVVEEVFRIFLNERLPYDAIAEWINTDPDCKVSLNGKRLTKAQVFRILRRPEYCGMEKSADGYRASEIFDPIITLENWIKAQRILGRKDESHKDVSSRLGYPLSGIIRCECGQYYYQSGSKYYAHKHLGKNENTCKNPNTYIRSIDIESYLLESLFVYCTAKRFRDDLFSLLWNEQVDKYSFIPDLAEIKARIDTYSKRASTLSIAGISDAEQIGKERLMRFVSDLHDVEMNIVDDCSALMNTTYHKDTKSKVDRLGYIERFVSSITVKEEQIIVTMKTGKQFVERIDLLETSAEISRLRKRPPTPSTEELDRAYSRWEKKNAALTEEEIDDHGYRQFLYELQLEHIANGHARTTKMRLYTATMRNAKKPSERIYLSDVYQWNGEGDYYIDAGGTPCAVAVHHASGQVIAVEALGDIYIDEQILHSSNVGLEHTHSEYFDLQNRKIIFMIYRRTIRAFDYSAFRRGNELLILSALADIELCPTAEFIDE